MALKVQGGDTVKYDARENGVKQGVVIAKVMIAPFRAAKGEKGPVYFNISGAGNLVPLEDILEVLA